MHLVPFLGGERIDDDQDIQVAVFVFFTTCPGTEEPQLTQPRAEALVERRTEAFEGLAHGAGRVRIGQE